jgi:glutamate dehydrogenase/leucine dehydrogenase
MKEEQGRAAKEIFKIMKKESSRQITFHYNPQTNLELIWVIDSIPNKRNKQGKLISEVSGGTRFAHQDADIALHDALKLSKAMTRKSKVLGFNQGGSKTVVLANQTKKKSFLQSIGDFIQIHKGLFRTAIDLGFVMKDGKQIASKTDFVDSLSHLEKGLGSTGDNTAEGIIHGYNTICKEILKKPLKECSVAIQGLGAVGLSLAQRLIEQGCRVIGADISQKSCTNAKKLGVIIAPPKKILFQKVDILAPCALGGIINRKTIPKLSCKVVAGGANNPLENEFTDEKRLLKRDIVYIPDFILNCGGFLQAMVEREGKSVQEARKRSKIVGEKLKQVIEKAKKENKTLLEAATNFF